MAKTVSRVPNVYLGNRDRLDGSYVCPNHKQELSSVYQLIDVLYNLRWMLSSSDGELVTSMSITLVVTSLSLTLQVYDVYACLHCTVQCLKYLLYLGNYWLLPNLGNDWLLPRKCCYWPYTSVSSVRLLT